MSLALAALLIFAAVFVLQSQAASSPASQRRFGFGFIGIGGLITNGYTPLVFFKGMFLTPPYPSTIELTMQDNSGMGNAFSSTGTQLPWLLQLMQLAAPYPNIQMAVHISFNLSSSTSWNVIETQFLPALKSSPGASSIGAIGFGIEQTNLLTSRASGCSGGSCIVSLWTNSLARLSSDVTADGWQFNSYYPQGLTNVPNISQYYVWQSSQPWAPQLSSTGPNIVGINIGGNGNNPWPSPECDYAGNPHWTNKAFPSDFYPNPAFLNSAPCSTSYPSTLSHTLHISASLPVFNRQWVIFYAGNNANSFCGAGGCPTNYVPNVGATGVNDYFNWDNVAFRDAIWNDGNYRGNFITSIGGATNSTASSTTALTTLDTTTKSSSDITSSTVFQTSTSSRTVTSSSNTGQSSMITMTRTLTSTFVRTPTTVNSASQTTTSTLTSATTTISTLIFKTTITHTTTSQAIIYRTFPHAITTTLSNSQSSFSGNYIIAAIGTALLVGLFVVLRRKGV